MGEVNTVEVVRAGDKAVKSVTGDMTFTVTGADVEGFEKGFLVVRPEVMKIGPDAEALANRLVGKLFNDYALGSRIQYQVRGADDSTWLIEKLQDNPFGGVLGDSVTVGWRPEDSILVKD
jgi:spermidine/putrescine transport system ATP-binding protein